MEEYDTNSVIICNFDLVLSERRDNLMLMNCRDKKCWLLPPFQLSQVICLFWYFRRWGTYV